MICQCHRMANCAHSRPMMTVSRSFSRINARNISSFDNNYGRHSKFQGLSRAFSRLKAIFHDVSKSNFFKKFTPSSYWFYNCVFRQSAICLQKVTHHPGYYYVALYYYSRFFYNSIKPPNFLVALSPFILKAATFDNSDENDNLIADELMASHSKDLDYIKSLTLNTLTCKNCQKRHLIGKKSNMPFKNMDSFLKK